MLDRGVFVIEPIRLPLGVVEDGDELPGQLRRGDAGAGGVWQPADRRFRAGAYLGERGLDGVEQVDRHPVRLAQDGYQQMKRVDERRAVAGGAADCGGECFLGAGGEPVSVHGSPRMIVLCVPSSVTLRIVESFRLRVVSTEGARG